MVVRRVALAVISILLLPATLYAWGGDGHQIVCLIAEEHLTKKSVAGIRELLGDDHISDAAVASWADNVRREKRSTGPWYYVDIPSTQPAYDAKRDGQNGANVIDKINDFATVLSDPRARKADRTEALKYLVHFVGDVHQPLHCTDRDDRGGNRRLVFFLDHSRAVSLHMVWDSTILLQRKNRTPILSYAMSLNKQIAAADEQAWATGTPEDWANESHAVAVKVAYARVPADGPPPKLDQAYVDKAADVIDAQLEKGGVRLAALLNKCFADAGTK
jgi:hypothetical protein